MIRNNVIRTFFLSFFNSKENFEPVERQKKIGLLVLLSVITSLFFLFIIAFIMRSQLSDWEHLSAPWKPLANPWLLWVNTGLLVLSSIALQLTQIAAKKKQSYYLLLILLLAGFFAGAFLVGQLLVWFQLQSLGYFVATNPANSFFYLLTGLHGLHLLGGLVAWVKTYSKAKKKLLTRELISSITLCVIYWHYLLFLWLVLFALLTSSPETFAAIAQFCGF